MRLLVVVILLWARLLVVVGGGRGTTKLRPQYDRGQHFQPFYSPTTTQIPQHIPPKISEYIQTTLNRKRSNEEGANFQKKIESRGLVTGRWQLIAMFI